MTDKTAAEELARAYRYLQKRLESIGYYGWAHDKDDEVAAALAARAQADKAQPSAKEAIEELGRRIAKMSCRDYGKQHEVAVAQALVNVASIIDVYADRLPASPAPAASSEPAAQAIIEAEARGWHAGIEWHKELLAKMKNGPEGKA